MLSDGKYYLNTGANEIGQTIMIQVSKHEHERIRNVLNQPLIEVSKSDKCYENFIWIDDPKCNCE